MTNKRKQRVHALMQKTGMSYQAAHNTIVPHDPLQPRSVLTLLKLLHASGAFSVQALRPPLLVQSADFKVAEALLHDLAAERSAVASSGKAVVAVTLMEMESLHQAGAAGEGIQMLRMARVPQLAFSDRCSHCGKWIFCGYEEHAAFCACGHEYRVTFDAVTVDWSKAQGPRCLDCGAAMRMLQAPNTRNPWFVVNLWQQRCRECAHGPSTSQTAP